MIWVYIYAILSSWIMLGAGFRLRTLMYWERRFAYLPVRVRVMQIAEGILFWPVCPNYDALERKYIDWRKS